MEALQCEDLLFAWKNLPVMQYHIHSWDCINFQKPFIFVKMKNAWDALRRLHMVAINPWEQKWFRQLANWCLALWVLAGDTAWHSSSNTHLVIVNSVEFGCLRGWSKAYLGLCAHVEKGQLSPSQWLFAGVRVFMSFPLPNRWNLVFRRKEQIFICRRKKHFIRIRTRKSIAELSNLMDAWILFSATLSVNAVSMFYKWIPIH